MSSSYSQIKRSQAEHIKAIRKNELLLSADPVGYERRVKRFAVLGYFLYALLVVLSLLVAYVSYYLLVHVRINKLTLYLAIFAVIFVFATLSSLIIRREDPVPSIELDRSDAPKLWSDLDKITKELDAPKIDRVVIDLEMNASALQWPRFGLFGKIRNHLTLGLPLMMSMTEPCLRGIIGHEMGHFAGDHGKRSGFLYRSAMLFESLYNKLNGSDGANGFLIRGIVSWFFPRLEQLSLPLSRVNEGEADRAEVKIGGREAYMEAMYRLGPCSLWYYKHVQTELIRRAPDDPLSWLEERLSKQIPTQIFNETLSMSIKDETQPDATHPCLRDRLGTQNCPIPTAEDADQLAARYNVDLSATAFRSYLDEKAQGKLNAFFGSYLTTVSEIALKEGVVSKLNADIDYNEIATESDVVANWAPTEGHSLLEELENLVRAHSSMTDAQFKANLLTFSKIAEQDDYIRLRVAILLTGIDNEKVLTLLGDSVLGNPSLAYIAHNLLLAIHDQEGNTAEAEKHFAAVERLKKNLNSTAIGISAGLGKNTSVPTAPAALIEDLTNIVNRDPRVRAAYLCNIDSAKPLSKQKTHSNTVLFFDSLTARQSKMKWTGMATGNSEQVQSDLSDAIVGVVLVVPLIEKHSGSAKKLKGRPEVLALKESPPL